MKKYVVLFILLFSFSINVYAEKDKDVTDETEKVVTEEVVTLDKCVDGDTANFKKSTGEIVPVRFLAIDTPESVHPTKGEEEFGKEASEFTCNLLTNATVIKLEYDQNSDKQDSYGRVLAWVFADDKLVEESIIDAGLGEVAYLYGDYKYTNNLKEKESTAKLNKIGMWNDEEESSLVNEEVSNTVKEKSEGFFSKLFSKVWKFIKSLVNKLVGSLSNLIDQFLNSEA